MINHFLPLVKNGDAEKYKIFLAEDSLSERLSQAWLLTCAAYGIDPENLPKMEKTLTAYASTKNNGKHF